MYSFYVVQLISLAILPTDIDRDRALNAFRSQCDPLALSIESCLITIANKLYSKYLISRDAKKEAMNLVNTATFRTVSLLSAVEDKIEAEPNVFAEFVSILQSEPTLRSQANKLIQEYYNSK